MRYHLRQQQTLARPARIKGFGYWKGCDIAVEFRPAPVDSGIVFVRSDLNPQTRIPALVDQRIEMPLRTTLAVGEAQVEMVEHVLAALAGLRIDNCEIWVDQEEMPGCDGSSLPFVEALLEAGIVKQDSLRSQIVIDELIRVGGEEAWVEARPAEFGQFSVEYSLDYGPDSPIRAGRSCVEVNLDSFCRQLAPARTFILKKEADWLRSQGLGRRVSYENLLVFDDHELLDNQLRFDDECIRHKALDMVGDLALAGCGLIGHFAAYRSGHHLNAELVKSIMKSVGVEKLKRSA